MYLGIDIGSSSSKVAIIDENKRIIATKIINRGTGTNAAETALEEALNEVGISRKEIKYTVVTGYGRLMYPNADKQVTELSCHAKGAHFLEPEADTIIDIGGQDAKAIRINNQGKVVDFMMNEKCAAGTGRFLEVVSRVLDTRLDLLAELADKATNAVSISSVCTVFAESEMISRLSSGADMADIARGANMSIAQRVAGLAKRVGIGNHVVMTGGVALNSNVVNAMSIVLGMPIIAVQNCQAVGAIGAALFAYEECLKMEANHA